MNVYLSGENTHTQVINNDFTLMRKLTAINLFKQFIFNERGFGGIIFSHSFHHKIEIMLVFI